MGAVGERREEPGAAVQPVAFPGEGGEGAPATTASTGPREDVDTQRLDLAEAGTRQSLRCEDRAKRVMGY